MSIKLNSAKQLGFTLLEILLVLFLLGLMASSTLLLTEGVESQAKYDETKHRLSMIRTAIVGDSSRTINGRPEISGFAADMGRLPDCLRELLTDRLCDDSDNLPLWGQDVDSQVWAGWRGPYLTGNTEVNGEMHFRDGYGNSSDTIGAPSADWQNSGWNFSIVNGDVIVISDGFNITNLADNVPNNAGVQQLVFTSDYQAGIGDDWQNVEINFYFQPLTETFIVQDSLRLKLNSPADGVILDYTDGELDTDPERDGSVFMSNAFPEGNDLYIPAKNGVINVANTQSITFSTNVTLVDATTVVVPATTIMTYDNGPDEGNFSCSQGCTLTIPNTGNRTFIPPSPALPTTITRINFTIADIVTFSPQLISPVLAPRFAKRTIIVPVGSSFITLDTLALPNGTTITFTGADPTLTDDKVFFDEAEITVSETFARTDNIITTAPSGDTFTVPANTTVTGANTLEVPVLSILNTGVKSFTIVCDLAAVPEQGNLFDGDCTDGVDNNINSPTNLTLLPKNTLPVNDEAIEWVIQ